MITKLTPPFPPHRDSITRGGQLGIMACGYSWLARRYSRNPAIPSVSRDELRLARESGIAVGTVVVNSGHSPMAGAVSATLFALEALIAVTRTGQRTKTTLFYDVTGDYPRVALPPMLRFFDRLGQITVNAGFHVGAYGPWRTIAYLLDQGAIEYAWLSNIVTNGVPLPRPYIQQLPGGWHEVRCDTDDGPGALELVGLTR